MHSAYSSTILCPKLFLWEFFQDPFASILTFFNQYKNAQASENGQLTFWDQERTKIQSSVDRTEKTVDQSEVSVKFRAVTWGELVVVLTLTEVDENKTECRFEVDFSGMSDESKREEFSRSINTRCKNSLDYVVLKVVKKRGSKQKFNVRINCPAEFVWKDVGDWANVRWIKGATTVKLIDDRTRRVFGGKKSVINKLVDLTNDSLVYEIVDAESVNCSYYRGVITVKENPDDQEISDVLYRNVWMPAKQNEAGDLKEKMKKMITRRLQWMKATYESRYRGYEVSVEKVQKISPAEIPENKTDGDPETGSRLVVEHDSWYEDSGSKPELPVMQGKFKQDFQATIPAVLNDVWEIVQDFGDGAETWWFYSTFLGFDGEDCKQHIGCIRNLSTGDEVVKDKLLFVSSDGYKLMFETIKIEPNKLALENCSYLISLEPGDKEPGDETEIVITANYDCLSVLKPHVEAFLRSCIEDSLKKLKEVFVQPKGEIEVMVINAEGIGLESATHVNSYCSICVDNNSTVVETSVVRDTVNPRWNETFKFEFYSSSSVVNVALWNKSITSAGNDVTKLNDDLMGIVNFALPSFSKTTTETKFKVPISSGYMFMKMRTCDGTEERSQKVPKQVISKEIEKIRDNLVAIFLKPSSLRPEHFQWKTQRRVKNFPAVETENLPGYCENVPSAEKSDHSKFGNLIAEIAQCVTSFRSQVVNDKTKSRIKSLYNRLPNSPEPTFSILDNDHHFCLQFFVGFSPNLVSCVHDINDIPTTIQKLHLEHKLQEKIKMKEVFAINFDPFKATASPGKGHETQAPILVFSENQEKTLEILGISTEDNIGSVLTPQSDKGSFNKAKLQLLSSLVVNHFYINVLLRNLYLDSINYSMYENLSPNHPVRRLLTLYLGEISHKVSFLRSLFLNNSPNLADIIFLSGSAGGIALLAENSKKLDVVEKFLDIKKDFSNRGFDFICSKYLFQHDVLRLQDVLMNLVSNYFLKSYQIDRDIESDEKLQRFFSTLIDTKKGNLNLQPEGVNTRSALTKFCTNVIFAATVMTSAFEKNLFSNCCLTAGFSTKLKEGIINPEFLTNEALFHIMFPPNNELFLQVLLAKLLSIKNPESFAEQSSVLGNKVREKFVKFSTEVKERNSTLKENDPKWFYKALDPFEIPANASL